MKTLISISLISHFVLAGALLGRFTGRFNNGKTFLWVFGYFFVAHLIFAYLVTLFPDVIDPRID